MSDKYEYIVNKANDFITLINRDYIYEIVNDTYCTTIGLDRNEVLNKSVSDVWGKETFDSRLKGFLDRCFRGENVHYVEQFKFGIQQRYMHVSYYPYGEGTQITHALVFSHDITKLGEIESKLINYEYRDPLTGLYNRRSLEIILDSELEKAKRARQERKRAVLFMEIVNLSAINRTYGHSIGSVLLENTGLRMKEALRNSDYVFRYEGSELVAILSLLTKTVDVGKVASKLVESAMTPYRYKELDIALDCKVGASIYPDDCEDRESLIKNALSALNQAIRENKQFLLFDAATHQESVNRLKMESDLRRAFELGQFELYYQPIVDLAGIIEGAEALIRWNTPDGRLLTPSDFIPLATETRIMELIDRWAIFTSAHQAAEWIRTYPIYVSVNLTAREFESADLVDVLRKALAQADGLAASALKIEITESEYMTRPEKATERIGVIRDLGIEVYIDDFGTGQSSLSYLKNLPVDAFKIDRIFARDLLESAEDLSFLGKIINLVKSRNRKVIVEGITSAEQVARIRGMGCDGFQGYYYSPAVRAEEFFRMLENGGRLPR